MKETVKVELLKDPECLMGFSCGEPSIDELIKKAYYETLLEKGYTYVAILNNRVIAVYQIAFITLSAEEISEDTNDHNWSGNSELRYGCLLIHYLAVVKKNVSTQKNRKYDTEWYTKRDFSAWTKVACSFYNY